MTRTDRTTLRAIMDAMKPGRSAFAEWHENEILFNQRARETLTNLKPSNTKAQLLEGIAEARQILEGGG